MKKLDINTRKCDGCGAVYFRRNLIECWTVRASGHRQGWFKEVAKLCMKCMGVKETRQIFGLVGVTLSRKPKELVGK